MNVIKAAGHIDPEQEKQDLGKLFDANYKLRRHNVVPQTSKKVDPTERQMVIYQRKPAAKRREDIKRRKGTQSSDAKRRYNERRKVLKRTRKS